MSDPLLVPLRTVCRMLGISETTYFRFRRCGGADVPVPVASPHRRLLFAAKDIDACVERWKRASDLLPVRPVHRAVGLPD